MSTRRGTTASLRRGCGPRNRRGAGVEAPSVPDFVSEYAGQAGAHQAGEVKVYNTSLLTQPSCFGDPGLRRDARAAARGDLGDFAPSEVVAPRSDGAARTAKYQAVLEGGARGRSCSSARSGAASRRRRRRAVAGEERRR